ncbi:hypothetical protein EIP91_005487 [Steccherinum ochraceum]|uniref:FAD dependent oxidoreductase domain-containing protein n=1 Tax=Steccherinum ochraceum TaxID=92696 RepID=A0A4R0RS90_9APHY|nr:hypothetical protein EIP91_005487 [Steccherinum ochraceum]
MATLPVPLHAWSEHQVALGLPPPPGTRTPLPVANSTKAFWFTDPNAYPAPDEGSEGPLTSDADICIIGSGVTGVSAAYHLAHAFSQDENLVAELKRPVKAIILEARDFCSGATGRNGGHLTPDKWSDFVRLENERGLDEALRTLAIERHTADELIRIMGQSGKADYVDLTHGGRLILLFSDEELAKVKANYEASKAAGTNMTGVSWLSKDDVWKQYGAPYPAVFIPGNNLWPLKAVGVLYQLAASASSNFFVDLHTHTAVTAITPISLSNASSHGPFPRRHNLTTPRGQIGCSYVLHATNAYVSHLLPHLTGPSGVVPTRGQVMAVRAGVPADELSAAGGIGNEGLEYWFPRPVKNPAEDAPLVIVGGGREVTQPGFEFYETDDSVVNPAVGKALRAFLPAAFPEKYEEDRAPELEWTGVMGYTRTGDPFVGRVVDSSRGDTAELDGQYLSVGYNGHGMPRAFACAEVVAGMIVSDIRKQKWEPPNWFPKSYLTDSPKPVS